LTNTPAAPVFPPGRYGRRRAPRRARRWLPFALAALVVLGALALVARLYGQYGNSPYDPRITATEQISDSSVTVTLTVRKRTNDPALCRVQARDRSGAEVGYAEVPVGPGGTATVRYRLATTARPYAVDVLGCRAA
jgi:uncharacterized protein (DUF58 family)